MRRWLAAVLLLLAAPASGALLLKQSTAQDRPFTMYDDDHLTPTTGLTVTCTCIKDGGASGACGGTVAEISVGWYKISLNTTDTNTLGSLGIKCTATGSDATYLVDQVTAWDPEDADPPVDVTKLLGTAWLTPGTAGTPDVNVKLIDGDAASASGTVTFPNATLASTTNITAGTVTTASTCTAVTAVSAGGIAAASFAAGAIDAAAIAPDALASSELAATAVTEIRDAITGGAYDLDTDANGRVRIVDGVAAGELDTASGGVAHVVLADTVTTYTGNTPQTGDVFPLASTEIADIKAKTDNLPTDPADASDVALACASPTEVATELGTYDAPTYTELLNLIRLSLRKDAALATDLAALLTTLNTDLGSGAGAYVSTTDSQEAARDNMGTAQTGDSYALANGASGFVATKADTAAILIDSNAYDTDAEIHTAAWGSSSVRALTILDEDSTTIDLDGSTIGTATTAGTCAALAANSVTAAALAADAGTELGTATWATATRELTALDEDVTAVDLNATTIGTVTTATTASTCTAVTTVNGLAAGVVTAAAIADGALDRATFAADTGMQTSRSNTAQAGAATTITLDASASATDDFYNNQIVYLTGGTGVGQARFVTDYVGATKVATVNGSWAANPDVTSTFALIPFDSIPGASAPTASQVADEVQTRTIAAVTSVTAIATGGITAASIATDAIGAAEIAPDAVGASEIAASAITSSEAPNLDAAISSRSTLTQTQVTGGAYDLDTDANGRIRIVDGVAAGELNTNAGAVALVDLVTTTTTATTASTCSTTAAVGTGAIVAGSFAAGAIDAAAIAPDAIGASEVATSALTKGTEIAGFNDLSAAQVNAEADTALADVGVTTTITGRIDAAISTRLATSGYTAPLSAAATESEVNDALVVLRLDELLAADSDIDGAAPPTVGSVFHEALTSTAGSFTFDQTTDSNEAIRNRGDAAWTTATGFSTHTAADVWTSGTRTLTAATNITSTGGTTVPQTGDSFARIGAAGAGLTALGDTRLANLDALISSRMATFTLPTNFSSLGINASGHVSRVVLTDTLTTYTGNTVQTGDAYGRLATYRLGELLSADSDIDGAAPPAVGSVFHEALTKTAGSFTFDQTTDSNEALRDRGDAAWTSDGTSVTCATVSDKTGYALSGAGVTAVQSGLATSSGVATDCASPTEVATELGTYDAPTSAELVTEINSVQTDVAAVSTTLGTPAGASVSADLLVVDNFVDDLETRIPSADATTAGTRLLTAIELDGAVYRFTTNALEQAPSGGSAPTAAENADAVLDELLADHAIGGSAGAALAAAGVAGDPLTAVCSAYTTPGTYGYIACSKLLVIGTSSALVASPVDSGGTIQVRQGVTYNPALGTAHTISVADLTAAHPTWTGGTATFHVYDGNTELTSVATSGAWASPYTATVASADLLTVTLTAAQTATMTAGNHSYQWKVVLAAAAGTSKPKTGTLVVVRP